MHNATIICDPLTAEIFMLTDFLIIPVTGNKSTAQVLEDTCRQGQTIIFITESLAKGFQEQIKAIQGQYQVTISIIPGIGSTEGLGEQILKKLISKVIGSTVPETRDDG